MLKEFNDMKLAIQDAIDKGDLVGVDPKVMHAMSQINIVSLGSVR